MFCPKCRYEYRRGFTICTDCNVPLVEELPEPTEQTEAFSETRYVEVLSTFDVTDIMQVKGILDAEGVRYYIHGEMARDNFPFVQPATVMVAKDDVQRASVLLKSLKLQFIRMIFSGSR